MLLNPVLSNLLLYNTDVQCKTIIMLYVNHNIFFKRWIVFSKTTNAHDLNVLFVHVYLHPVPKLYNIVHNMPKYGHTGSIPANYAQIWAQHINGILFHFAINQQIIRAKMSSFAYCLCLFSTSDRLKFVVFLEIVYYTPPIV